MKRFRKIASYALVGGSGLVISGSLAGCVTGEENSQNEQNIQTGAFVIIEEIEKGKYKILEEFPSEQTRIVLRELGGNERVLSKEEMDALIAEENAKIDNGTSNLTNQNAQLSSGGLSLGEAILASAAGAIIGSWIGNKLFGSPAYQNYRQSAYKTPSAYSRSVDSFDKAKQAKATSGKKSGFFGGGSKSGTKSSSFGG